MSLERMASSDEYEEKIMNTGIIIALVIALAIGGIIWLVIRMNRQQPQRNIREMSIREPEPPSDRRAA
jgi:flagellar biogenesis protein FliO